MTSNERNDTSKCIFCKIIKREIPATIIYEDADVICFEDINSQAPKHYLLIPKVHIATLNDIASENADIMNKIFSAVPKIAAEKGFDKSGYRTVINTEKDAGQVVWHIHLHILAGRAFGWPPG